MVSSTTADLDSNHLKADSAAVSFSSASFDTVSLIGWNGMRNVGDDAMTAVMINYVLQNFQQPVSFELLADDDTLAHYACDDDIVAGFKYYNTFQNIPYIRRWLNPLLFDRRLANAAPVMLIGGGSIFHSVFRSQRMEKMVAATRRAHPSTLIGALGVSLGPFKRAAESQACQQVLRSLDFIAVRDRRSWEVFQSLEVDIPAVRAMDIALMLPDLVPDFVPKISDSPSVGVALRHGHTPPAMMAALVTSLNDLQAAHPDVVVELLNFSDIDEVPSAALRSQLNATDRVRLYPYNDRPEAMYQQLSECTLVLASRLHAGVISYGVGTAFGMLTYHQKCIDFAHEVGLDEDWILPVDSLSADTLSQRLKGAILENRLPTVQLPVEVAREKARMSFQFLDAIAQTQRMPDDSSPGELEPVEVAS